MIDSYMKQYLPDYSVQHIMDTLIKRDNNNAEPGQTPPDNIIRYTLYAKMMENYGCSAIFSCCSFMAEAVEYCKKAITIPIYQLDEIAIQQAVGTGGIIGIISANRRVVPHVEKNLQKRARENNKEIQLKININDKAYEAMSLGNIAEHNQLLMDDIKTLNKKVDCILLGHINLALLEDSINDLNPEKPVYFSGSRTFKAIREIFAKKLIDK
jgi:glutamate racemase